MKKTVKYTLAVLLSLALTVGTGGALAYTTPDFTDVAAGNWAYAPIMQMADEGIIKGTSSTTFAPEMKVSAAMWLTLLGRAVYDVDAKAAAQMGDIWYSAYVRVAESKGLLTGTNITQEAIEGEVSRYDMAVTLYGAVKLMGGKDAAADTSKIADYGEVPTKYATAVAQVYAQGLIKGDGQARFNGTNTMRRDEAATVMVRLLDLKAKLDNEVVQPETPAINVVVSGTTSKRDILRSDILPLANAHISLYENRSKENLVATWNSDATGNFETVLTLSKKLAESQSSYYVEAYGSEEHANEKYKYEGSFWLSTDPTQKTTILLEQYFAPGEKIDLTINGTTRISNPQSGVISNGTVVGNVQVILYHKDGTVLGSTTSNSDGAFSLNFSVDGSSFSYDAAVYYFSAQYTDTVTSTTYKTTSPMLSTYSYNEYISARKGNMNVQMYKQYN